MKAFFWNSFSGRFYKSNWIEGLLALFITYIIFTPTLHGYHNFSLYGDGGTLYTPAISNLIYQLHHKIIYGFDMLTSNWSSDYFLRANIPIYYPLILLLAGLFSRSTFGAGVEIYSVIVILQTIIALYFTLVFCKRFLKLDRKLSLFTASIYIFSQLAAGSLLIFPFYLLFTLFPLCLYTTFSMVGKKSKIQIVLMSTVYVLIYLSGYIPLAILCILLSLIFCFFYNFSSDANIKLKDFRPVFYALILATLVVSLYYLAVLQFLSYAQGDWLKGIKYAVYDDSESISQFIASFSRTFSAQAGEHYLIFSEMGLLIFALFISHYNKQEFIKFNNKPLFNFSLVATGLTLLLSFGSSIVLSLVYYFSIPILNNMHGYQRYFLFTSFFMAILCTLSLKYYIENINYEKIKKCLYVFVTFLFLFGGVIYFGLLQPKYYLLFNEHFFVVILVLTLFLISCLFFDERGIVLAGIFFVALLGLQGYYYDQLEWSAAPLMSSHQEDVYDLNNYFKVNSSKQLIKYVNLTADVNSYVSPNYPWHDQAHIKLSNYMGYEQHLSQDKYYRYYNNFYGSYNWDWLRKTGAEFIIYDQDAYKKYKTQIDAWGEVNTIKRLKNGDIVERLKPSFASYSEDTPNIYYDNGYVSVLYTKQAPTLTNFVVKTSQYFKFHLNVKDETTRIYIPNWCNRHLKLKVNQQVVPFSRFKLSLSPPTDKLIPYENNGEDKYAYGLCYYDLPKGDYDIKVYYSFPLLIGFLIIYALYWLMIAGVSIYALGKYFKKLLKK